MPRPTLNTLSDAQRRVLDVVVRRERWMEPNFVSELVAELGMKAESSLAATLQRMVRLGVIVLQGGGARGRQRLVVSTAKGRLLSSMGGVLRGPLGGSLDGDGFLGGLLLPLLGSIPAGPLEEVVARGEAEVVEMDALLKARAGDFLLRVEGDSMVGDGILDGDLVLLRPEVEVNPGEIAAVIATGAGGDCEATLKHVFWYADRQPVAAAQATEVCLRASNPAYADMVFPAQSVRIAGVFRGLIRPGASANRLGGVGG